MIKVVDLMEPQTTIIEKKRKLILSEKRQRNVQIFKNNI